MRSIWRRLGIEQRVAGVAAVLLIISTIGPFSWVEAGIVLTGGGVLALLRARGWGRRFHLPFGDGAVIMLAAGWAALLILSRIGDRPFGQTVLAWVCTALLGAAGLRERDRRPRDDIYRPRPARPVAPVPARAAPDPATAIVSRSEDLTEPVRDETEATRPLRDSRARRPVREDDPPRPR